MTISIHTVLRNLIEEKSKRDGIEFTAYQLARALDMPRSLITSLTHSDESKRVVNPRISTLLKIVDFFRADGFNIKIEDLLGLNTNIIDIAQEQPAIDQTLITIPVYSLANKKLGTIDLNISNSSTNVIALHINEEIPPFFKMGSIFIIDKDLSPENENLVAVTLNNPDQFLIKKYLYSKGKTYLQSLDKQEKIVVMPTMQLKIIGVIIQVNAKT
ncbi:MAG TPA: S24 family peptidase [Candidatus Saccharimonadales bacterium]|nr:S24 family peptidase [Candidatus Saccharimonadales bacterium]